MPSATTTSERDASGAAASTNTGDAQSAPRLRIIGVDGSHDTLRRVVGARSPCTILDVPAGEGVFCEFLRDRGFDVHAADIDPGNFRLQDIPFTRVNLNEALPFDDDRFDAVSCVNGLHRLLFPEVALREFFRILRPGGSLFVNLNNYSSIRKRLRFLLTGSLDQAIETQHCIQTIDDPQAHVRLPLMYPRLRTMLLRSGFEIVDVEAAAVTPRDRLLAPLALALRAADALVPASRKRDLGAEGGNENAVVAGGAYFFVEAAKPRAQG